MKKTTKFESLNDAKFRTAESRELKSVTGGLVMDSMADTITIYGDGSSANDGQSYPIDRGKLEEEK
jgi:hypothetical protein